MASLDTLPADQRAVLSLVLERGKSYDEIAQMLSIDRTSVRERALAAFDALGPRTQISDLRRALITDYLLGQLPPAVAQETRDRLAANPSERAWARVLASELAPLSSGPLPEIPAAGPAAPAAAVAARNGEPDGVAPLPAVPAASADGNGDNAAGATALGSPEPDKPRSSRVGGIILLVGAALVVIAVVLVIVLSSGGSSSSNSSSAAASVSASSSTATNPTAPSSSTSGAAASTTPTVVAQINLKPPSGGSKSEAGIAEVLKEGSKKGIAIVAQHMPPNTHKPPNAYAVWLYNSSKDAKLLGFVNPGVGKSGRLSTAGPLPTNASHFHKLIVTLETTASPKTPGAVVLSGAFTGS